MKIKIKRIKSANVLASYLFSYLYKRKKNKVILTGGKSSPPIYKKLFKKIKNEKVNLSIFLSDERIVNLKSKNLNARLFQNLKNNNIKFNPVINMKKSIYFSTNRYSKILPSRPNFIFLSIGKDGHLASIFENSKAMTVKKKFFFEDKKYNSFKRATITMNYLKDKKNVILLCKGEQRLKLFEKLIEKKGSVLNILSQLNQNLKLLII